MKKFLFKTLKYLMPPLVAITLVLAPIGQLTEFKPRINQANALTVTVNGGVGTMNEGVSASANTGTAVSTAGTAFILKVYRAMIRAMARALIKSILSSTLNWVNNGFNGNPLYIQNLSYYFKSAVDQEIGSFLAADSDLNFLCSPYRLNIKRALLLQRRSFASQSSCTLTGVLDNFNNFVSGAQGEFSKGGWSAWNTMVTEPQNNPYGAYTLANLELSARIESALGERKIEANTGMGFMSWRDTACVAQAKAAHQTQQERDDALEDEPAGPPENTDPNQCPINTPGSVIAGQVNSALPDDLRQLELAQEIDDIIGAVAVQLMTRALGEVGLFGMSSSEYPDEGDPLTSFNEQEEAQYEHDRTQMIDDINLGISNENSYAAAKEVISGRITESQNLHVSLINCIIRKLATSTTATGTTTEELIPAEQRTEAINDMNAASSTLFRTIVPEKTAVRASITRSDAIITNLNRILSAVARLTVNDQTRFIGIMNQYATIQSQVHIPADVLQVRSDYSENIIPRYEVYDTTVRTTATKYNCTLQ